MEKIFEAPYDPQASTCLFIIFGATGDLTRRKLIPALCKLIEERKIDRFALIGASIDATTPEELIKSSTPYVGKVSPQIVHNLIRAFYYHQMNFYDAHSYNQLACLIKKVEEKHFLSGNRLFYFATMPDHFAVITKNLLAQKIVHDSLTVKNGWERLVYEKPFGHDLKSSQAINKLLTKAFKEDQIFRIDHYLGKELTGNISLARFTNRVFEPLWNKQHIDAVYITLSETLGIGSRGLYYDQYGAIKDMVQSHMLQLLALTAMDSLDQLTADKLRSAKAQVLKKVIVEEVVRGQYDGYLQEKNVKPTSTTETFVAIRLKIKTKRWEGVPFYLITGKSLDKKETSIKIQFKMVKCPITFCPSEPNYLTFKIDPEDGIYLGLNAKLPGIANEVAPVTMDFCHSCLFGPNTPEAYENLLFDVIRGDQAAFLRKDEIESSWKIVEQINAFSSHFYIYKQGSADPCNWRKILLTKSCRI